MKKILILLTLTYSLNTIAYSKNQKSTVKNKQKKSVRKTIKKQKAKKKISRWLYLMKLINEEEKTILKVRHKSQRLRYRLLELYSEKIKLYKERENKKFIKISQRGKKVSRKKAFSKTLSQYAKTRKYALDFLKKYPNSSLKGQIWYTLALNSRDYAYDNKQLKYLKNALYFTKIKSSLWYLINVSMAEYHYNNKSYQKAVALYDKIIYNDKDEWFTKNLYNYGWCLLKTHKFKKAIDMLEKGHKLSKNKDYIDFREQITNSLVNFYVIGKEVQRGIAFIKNNEEYPFDAFFKFAKKTSSKGFYDETLEILDLAQNNFNKGEEKIELADIELFKFDFYKNYKKDQKLFETAQNFTSITLSPSQKEEAVRKISEEVGLEQIIIKKDFDKYSTQFDQKRLGRIKDYFSFLSTLDPDSRTKYKFYEAETLYSVERYEESLERYKLAIELYENIKNSMDIRKKALDGIFSSIEFLSFDKKREKKELKYAYHKYLDFWPKNDKSKLIFSKLFAIYLSDKDYSKMSETLVQFKKNFPSLEKIQKDLFRTKLDLLIKEENTKLLSQNIKAMQSGPFKFSKAEIKKSEIILANLLFNKFQRLNKNGKPKKALTGYKEVFYNREYPKMIKAQAAFNIGLIYTDLFDSSKSIKWFKKSFPLFTKTERLEKRKFLEKMSLRSSLLQDHLNAAHIQRLVLDNFCLSKKENSKNFEQAIDFDLANDYVTKAIYTYDKYQNCANVSKSLNKRFIKHLYDFGHEAKLLSFVDNNNLSKEFSSDLAFYYERLYWKYYKKSRSKSITYKNYLLKVDKKKYTVFFSNIKKLEKLVNSIRVFSNNQINLDKKFDGKVFNDALNKRISSVSAILLKSKEIIKFGNARLTILVYNNVIELLDSLSSEIENYTPKNLGPEFPQDFLVMFKRQMKSVSEKFSKESKEYRKAASGFREKYEILALELNQSRPGFDILNELDLRIPVQLLANTYDLAR